MRAVFVLTDNYYVALATALTLIILVAAAVHHFVEVPTNNYGRRPARRMFRRRSHRDG